MLAVRAVPWVFALLVSSQPSSCGGGKSTTQSDDSESETDDAEDDPEDEDAEDDREDDDSSGSGESGEVPSAFGDFCVATFAEDTDVLDIFGDVELRVKEGERYLLLSYGNDFDPNQATLGYWTEAGPHPVELFKADNAPSFPFTSNCTAGSANEYYAVYADVDLFDDLEFSSRACSLRAGTVVRRDPNLPSGFSIASEINLSGPSIYQIELNALAPYCGDAQRGYALVEPTQVLDTTTGIIPIGPLLGP